MSREAPARQHASAMSSSSSRFYAHRRHLGLDETHGPASNVLLQLHVLIAVRKALQLAGSQGLSKCSSNGLPQAPVGATAEDGQVHETPRMAPIISHPPEAG